MIKTLNFKHNWKLLILSLLSGFSFAPTYLIFFLPFAIAIVINKVLTSKNKKEAFFVGVSFGFCFFLTQLYWISFSLFTDIKTFFWLLPFVICLIPAVLSMFIGGSTLSFYFFAKKYNMSNKLYLALLFSVCFVIFEYFRSFIFPWNYISYIWAFSDIIIQISSVLNIYIFDVITMFLMTIVFTCSTKKSFLIPYVIIALHIITFGMFRLHNATPNSLPLNVRVVQANIKQSLKWDNEKEAENLQKHLNLTLQPGIDEIDLIIWPESSIERIMTLNSRLPLELNYISDKYLITGSLRAKLNRNNQIEKIWNSAFVFKNGRVFDFYDKFVLVPFGEFIPFGNIFPFIRTIAGGGMDFSRGEGNKTIIIDKLKLSIVICYEIIFPSKVVNKNEKPDVIVNITNDAWFGISSGPYQHLVAAKFRAIENSIPVIRANNSGISAYIDKYGRIVKNIGLREHNYFDIYDIVI